MNSKMLHKREQESKWIQIDEKDQQNKERKVWCISVDVQLKGATVLSLSSWLQGRTLPSLLLSSPRQRRTASANQLSPPPHHSRVTLNTHTHTQHTHPMIWHKQADGVPLRRVLGSVWFHLLLLPVRANIYISVIILLLLLKNKSVIVAVDMKLNLLYPRIVPHRPSPTILC